MESSLLDDDEEAVDTEQVRRNRTESMDLLDNVLGGGGEEGNSWWSKHKVTFLEGVGLTGRPSMGGSPPPLVLVNSGPVPREALVECLARLAGQGASRRMNRPTAVRFEPVSRVLVWFVVQSTFSPLVEEEWCLETAAGWSNDGFQEPLWFEPKEETLRIGTGLVASLGFSSCGDESDVGDTNSMEPFPTISIPFVIFMGASSLISSRRGRVDARRGEVLRRRSSTRLVVGLGT